MEQFNFLKFLAKYWIFIAVITLAVGAAAYLVSGRENRSVLGSVSVTVNSSTASVAGDRLVLQSNPLAENQVALATVQGWLNDPVVISEILAGAKQADSGKSVRSLAKTFEIVSPIVGSPTFQVEFTGTTTEETTQVLQSLVKVLQVKATEYNARENATLQVRVLSSSPITGEAGAGVPLTPLAGLVAGFLFALIIAALVDRRNN